MSVFKHLILAGLLIANQALALTMKPKGPADGIPESQVYAVKASGRMATVDMLEAVGKKIRQDFYQKGMDVDQYKVGPYSWLKAERLLADNEYTTFDEDAMTEINIWIEDKRTNLYSADIRVSRGAGSALYKVLIFLPDNYFDSVLTIFVATEVE